MPWPLVGSEQLPLVQPLPSSRSIGASCRPRASVPDSDSGSSGPPQPAASASASRLIAAVLSRDIAGFKDGRWASGLMGDPFSGRLAFRVYSDCASLLMLNVLSRIRASGEGRGFGK